MTLIASYSRIPAALPAKEAAALLDTPLALFFSDRALSHTLKHTVRTVADIVRAKKMVDLCTDEAEGIFVNRFSPEMASSIRSALVVWLSSLAKGDAHKDDSNHAVDPRISTEVPLAFDDRGVLIPSKRDEPPDVEMPPSEGVALDAWAARYQVSERLLDGMRLETLASLYGILPESLPKTVREAMLVTVANCQAPKYVRAAVVSQSLAGARTYLRNVAMAVAMAERRQAERAARTREPEDPILARFLKLVRQQRDQLAAATQPRPSGTFLPVGISLRSEVPALAYAEWGTRDQRPPNFREVGFLEFQIAAWDSGVLRLVCPRCVAGPCSHGLSAVDELIATLCDPEHAVNAGLVPLLRVPGWSRLLDHLDARLAKAPREPEEPQRLIWEIAREHHLMSLAPVMQKQGKRGVWSRGQRLTLEALRCKPFLLKEPTDLAAFEALTDGHEHDSYTYRFRAQEPRRMWRALAALAGATRVFADSGRTTPLSIRKVRPALRVEAVEGGFRLCVALGSLDVDPTALLAAAPDEQHVIWVDQENHRCLLARLDSNTMALISAMGRYPVVLPSEGISELVDRLPHMQATMDVHLPESVRGERVEPPTTILCRIEPLAEEGLRLDMLVRPIVDGPVFPPGEGPPELLHARDRQRLHAQRALASERERGLHLAQGLGLDESHTAGPWRWDVPDDQTALDMLGKLQALPELAEVEWPAGELRVDRVSRGALKVQVLRRRDWFGAEGGVDVDGTLVPLSDLLAAARAGRRYVRLDGRRFAAIEQDLRDKLAALDDVVFENQGVIELSLLAAPLLAELVPDPRQLDVVPAFKAILGRLACAHTEPMDVPQDLRATLRPYQVDGIRWLARLASWGLGACLADDMGLGKTLQALALLLRRSQQGTALVIAPTSVVANWAAECAKFAPGLGPRLYRGADRASLREGLGPGSLLITSYAIAVRDAEALAAIRFATLIIDEAQSVKNALTHRFRAIRDLQADFRVALTGTPIENHLGELWAIFRLVTPGLMGSWEQFRARFALPIERYHDRGRQAALARVVRPYLLRRTKAEVAPELPARTEMNQSIELGPTERRLYEAARVEILESLAKSAAAGVGDEARQRIKILAALTRLRLLCCHPRLVVESTSAGSAKLAALVELLTELRDEGHRTLVFSQFTSFLDLARPLLESAGLRILSLDGSTPAATRDERVRAFQAREADAFLLSLRAGGTGLNLTAATYVIHLDPWWNPAVEDQATDRAHRIGQDRPVTVIRLVARGTIEEAVLSLHQEKRQLAASILDGADAAARLDSNDLLDLIRNGGSDEVGEEEDKEETEVLAKVTEASASDILSR